MPYTIREANAKDADRINELFIQMLQTIYEGEDVQGYEEGYLDKFFERDSDLIYVAESNDLVIGFLSVEGHFEEETPFIYLDDFSVAREHRGNGVGTKLLRLAERYAAEHDFENIFLHVEASNVRARKLYEKFGYEEYETSAGRIKMVKRTKNGMVGSEASYEKNR